MATSISNASTRVSAGTIVYRQLRDQIAGLQLQPGMRLNESELSATLQVSRTPLREAIRMLLTEGLVVQLPTGGVVVSELSERHLHEVYSARAAIEEVIARQACRNATADDARRLRALLERLERSLEDAGTTMELGGDFHRVLADIADHSVCNRLLDQLSPHTHRYRTLSNDTRERREQALAEHREIVNALETGDSDLVGQLMRRHIETAANAAAESDILAPAASAMT